MAQKAACVIEEDRFGEMTERVRLGVIQETRRGAEGIVGHAKQYIIATDAILTGDLYRSVHAEYSAGGTAAEVVADVDYAEYVHDGTRHMRPRPFFSVAVKEEMPEIEARLGRMLEDRA